MSVFFFCSVNEFLGCMSFGIRHLTSPKKVNDFFNQSLHSKYVKKSTEFCSGLINFSYCIVLQVKLFTNACLEK